MVVPLVDLKAAHAEVAPQVDGGFARVLAMAAFVQGPDVAQFEREYAEYVQVQHCIGVANGTDALEIALRAVGVGPGDEVILPANTFIATAEAVWRIGARAVLVDVHPDTLLMDVAEVESVITSRTRAVVPVHLYGQAPDLESLEKIAQRHDLAIVEDAAQSQGAAWGGKRLGGWGRAAATSFYPGKNLGAYGDAGAVLTNDDEVARIARSLGSHGSTQKYRHDLVGFNSRLDTLQAVVLRAKLPLLDGHNAARQAAAARYRDLLSGLPEVQLPEAAAEGTHVWHLFVVQVDERDRVVARLNEAGIGAAVHYPVPVHLHPAAGGASGGPGAFPLAERAAGRILSLPLFPQITPAQQEAVVAALRAALHS